LSTGDGLSFQVIEPSDSFTPPSFLNAFANDDLVDYEIHCPRNQEVGADALVRLSYLGDQKTARTYAFSYPTRANPHEKILLRLPSSGILLIEVVARNENGLVWLFRNIDIDRPGRRYEITHGANGFSVN